MAVHEVGKGTSTLSAGLKILAPGETTKLVSPLLNEHTRAGARVGAKQVRVPRTSLGCWFLAVELLPQVLLILLHLALLHQGYHAATPPVNTNTNTAFS